MTNIPTMHRRGHNVQTSYNLLQFLPRIHLLAGESCVCLCVCIIYLLLGVNCLVLSHVLPFWLKTSRARPSPSAKRWLAPSAIFHLFFFPPVSLLPITYLCLRRLGVISPRDDLLQQCSLLLLRCFDL